MSVRRPRCVVLLSLTRSFSLCPVFQRSPLLEPSWNKSSPCYNPNSTVEIMCTLWNTPINMSAVDLNFGWPRGGFQVAIVGELRDWTTLIMITR